MDNLKPSVESINVPANLAVLMLNILNVTSRRGVFTPEEFKPVGELYEFVKSNLKLEDLKNQDVKTENVKVD
tara:strand:+ start:37 stop:252 length:216 start_codon:yes stop_codon:yes gene_type:complete